MLNAIKTIGKIVLIGVGVASIYEMGRYSGIYDAEKEFAKSDDDRFLAVTLPILGATLWIDRNDPLSKVNIGIK